MTEHQPDERLDAILAMLESIASLDFSERLAISSKADSIDAVASGLNMLSEELESSLKDRDRNEEQLRQLAQRITEAREEEAAHIGRELHDELGQAITALRLDLISCLRAQGPKDGVLAEKAEGMMELLDSMTQSVRRLSSSLHPHILEDLGLTAGIEWLADGFMQRTGTKTTLDLHVEEKVPGGQQATTVFRICQEALTNVARHADADEVLIKLETADEGLTLEVRDNGKGIDPEADLGKGSLGLLGMQERALARGGQVVIDSTPGHGTSIRARIPLERTANPR